MDDDMDINSRHGVSVEHMLRDRNEKRQMMRSLLRLEHLR